MRVLDVSSVFPYPPWDGNRNPVFNFLKALARRGVQYALLSPMPADRDQWEEGRKILADLGIQARGVQARPVGAAAQAWRCLAHGRPWVNRSFSPELARAAEAALAEEPWDLIQAEAIMGAQHLPARLGRPSVLIARDCLSVGYHGELWRARRSIKEWIAMRKIGWMERTLCRRFDRVMAISEADAAALRAVSPGARVEVLPNGVDLDLFRPSVEGAQHNIGNGNDRDADIEEWVVFTGAMDFEPNADAAAWLASDVWPRVRAERPRARLAIVGHDPLPGVRALAARDPSIVVTGTVPRVQDWLERAAVVVAPLRLGTGMKNKVLEAAACGKAIVSTAKGLENIALEPGRDLVLANGAEAFARQTARLLADPAERRRLGRNARSVVEAQYGYDAQAERLWNVYQELLAEGATANAGQGRRA
jgi:glycosyltransferase involved in cell wall biosynthesis